MSNLINAQGSVVNTVDTREYAWSDITALVGGKPLVGVTSVQYSAKQKKEAIYGKGNRPIAIQPGNIEYSGTIEVTQSEYYAMRKAGGGSILNLNVDIQVAYGNPPMPVRSDMLIGCQFTEENMGMSQNDPNMKVSIPFVFLNMRQAL